MLKDCHHRLKFHDGFVISKPCCCYLRIEMM